MTFDEIIKIKKAGIYKITNTISKNAYVGQARVIGSRIKSHLSSTFKPTAKDYNYPIHVAIRKYGLDAFEFEVLELCDISKLNEQEKYWVAYYDTRNNGYNQTDGGYQSIRHVKLTKEAVKQVIAGLKTGKTHAEIAKQFNISADMVHKINTGRSWFDSKLNYPINIERPYSQDYNGHCICQYSKDGNLINKFTSTHIAAQKLFGDDRKHSHIAACIRGDRKSAWGFFWKDEEISREAWLILRKAEE